MRKLAIVGSHSETRHLAPWDDPAYEIWLFNEAAQMPFCKRWDAVFQLHKPEIYTSPDNFVNREHWAWLQKDHGAGKIIYMQDQDPRVPNSRRFPIDEIKRVIPAAGLGWFTSSVSYALALAIFQDITGDPFDQVDTYGIDLASNTEYAYQQPNYLYWLGAAQMIFGRRLTLHSGLQHFDQPLYGYQGQLTLSAEYWQAVIDETEPIMKAAKTEFEKKFERLYDFIRDRKPDKFADALPELQTLAINAAQAQGMYDEAKSYQARTDPIPRQEFERHSAEAQRQADAIRSKVDRESGKVEYVWNSWRQTFDPNAAGQLRAFTKNLVEYMLQLGGFTGVYDANIRSIKEYDQVLTAAGGTHSLVAAGLAPAPEPALAGGE